MFCFYGAKDGENLNSLRYCQFRDTTASNIAHVRPEQVPPTLFSASFPHFEFTTQSVSGEILI